MSARTAGDDARARRSSRAGRFQTTLFFSLPGEDQGGAGDLARANARGARAGRDARALERGNGRERERAYLSLARITNRRPRARPWRVPFLAAPRVVCTLRSASPPLKRSRSRVSNFKPKFHGSAVSRAHWLTMKACHATRRKIISRGNSLIKRRTARGWPVGTFRGPPEGRLLKKILSSDSFGSIQRFSHFHCKYPYTTALVLRPRTPWVQTSVV